MAHDPSAIPPPEIAVTVAVQRFADPRGLTAVVYDGEPAVGFIEYVEFAAAGDARGSHFHRSCAERLLVLEGELRSEFATVVDDRLGAVRRLTVGAGSLVEIPPATAHRFTALAPSRAISFGSGTSPLDDRHPVPDEAWGDAASAR